MSAVAMMIKVALLAALIVQFTSGAVQAVGRLESDLITEFYAIRHSSEAPNELIKISVHRSHDSKTKPFKNSAVTVGKFLWADVVEPSYGKMYLIRTETESKLVTEMPIIQKKEQKSGVKSVVVFSPSAQGLGGDAEGRVVVQPPAGWKLSTWAVDQDQRVVMGAFVPEGNIISGLKIFHLRVGGGTKSATVVDVPFKPLVAKFARKLITEMASKRGNTITSTFLGSSAVWCKNSQKCFLASLWISDQMIKVSKGFFGTETTQERHRDIFRAAIRVSVEADKPQVASSLAFQQQYGDSYDLKFMSRKEISSVRMGQDDHHSQTWSQKHDHDFQIQSHSSSIEDTIPFPAMTSSKEMDAAVKSKDTPFHIAFKNPSDSIVWVKNLQDKPSKTQKYVRVDRYVLTSEYVKRVGHQLVFWRIWSADMASWEHASIKLGKVGTDYRAYYAEEDANLLHVSSFAETENTY